MAQVRKDKVQVEVEINGQRRVGKTINEIRKLYKDLNKELNQLEVGTDEYIKKWEEAKKIKGILDEQRLGSRKVAQGMKDASKESVNLIGNLKNVGKGLLAAFGPIAVILTAVNAIVDLTRETFRAQEALTAVNERISQLTALQGEGLRDATAQAQALANVYEIDVQEGVNAANAATRAFIEEGEELGEVYQENLDLIGDRLSILGDKGGEFLNQVTEYSVQAKIAGLSSEQFFNLVAEGINKGIPTDKLIDSVKEFDIRIKTLTKGQRATLQKVLGQDFATELEKSVRDGTQTSFEALQQVSEHMLALGEDSALARELMSDLFGGPGEDAAQFAEILATTTENFEDLTGATNIYSQQKRELAALEEEAQKQLTELNFQLQGSSIAFQKAGIILKTIFYAILNNIVELFNYFPDYLKVAGESLKGFVNTGIDNIETLLRLSVYPLIAAFEALTGKELRFGRLEVDTEAYNNLQVKIREDREKFAADEAARQKARELLQVKIREDREKFAADEAARQKARELALVTEAATKRGLIQQEIAEEERKERAKLEIKKISAEKEKEFRSKITAEIGQNEIDHTVATEAAKQQISQDNSIRLSEIEINETQKKDQIKRDLTRQFYQAAFSLAQAASERRFHNQIESIEAQKQQELRVVGNNEKAKREIEERFEKEKIAAEKDLRRRRKLFELAQVAINTAQSIVKTGAELGYPQAIPFQVAAGVIGAVQAGVIAAQKFEKGGQIPQQGRGGITNGPRHAQGGIKMYDSISGRYVGEAEGGEVILSRATYANNKELVNALLFSSRHKQGERVYESGGILSNANTTPSASTITTATEFSDTNIVRELRLLRQGVQGIDLRIGEREATEIGELYDGYRSRKQTTHL